MEKCPRCGNYHTNECVPGFAIVSQPSSVSAGTGYCPRHGIMQQVATPFALSWTCLHCQIECLVQRVTKLESNP